MGILETILNFIKPLLEGFVSSHPWAAAVLGVIAMCRLFIKPVIVAIEQIVAATENKDDDALLAKIKASNAYGIGMFLLDWFFSIKRPDPASVALAKKDK